MPKSPLASCSAKVMFERRAYSAAPSAQLMPSASTFEKSPGSNSSHP